MPTIDLRFTRKGAFHVLSHDSPGWFTISTNPIFGGIIQLAKKSSPFKVHKKTLGPGFPDLFGWKFDQILYPLISGLWNGCHFIWEGVLTVRHAKCDLCSYKSHFLRGIEDCRLATKLHTLEALTIVDTLTFFYPSSFCSSCLKPPLLGYWLTIVLDSNSIYSTPTTLTTRTVGVARSTFWGNDMARCPDLRLTGTEHVAFVGTVWSLVFLKKVRGAWHFFFSRNATVETAHPHIKYVFTVLGWKK